MKRKICVRSMVLGAVIMLIGFAVGAIVSPPLLAQREGVFGEILCTGVTVMGKNEKAAIRLGSYDDNCVFIYDKRGKAGAILCAGDKGTGVSNL